ncbi:MAG: M48 family metallopeptidase [Bacteroidales bacterium]|nr:M48 family metallopeptidase [Bacteroidales bacterium]
MDARMIMHPSDVKAIQAIKSLRGFDDLVRLAMDYGYEHLIRGENLGEMIKVTSENFPQVYYPFLKVIRRVGIDEPELYIYNDPVMNAYTYGDTAPFVAISSSVVEKLNQDELMGVLAHECGHIVCHHTLYNTILAMLINGGFALNILSETLLMPIYAALRYWSRCSEFSADRCSAAVVGERTFQMENLKMTCGLAEVYGSPYQLVEQAREYQNHCTVTLWDRLQQSFRVLFNTHPQSCQRALEIDRWKYSWQYRHLRAEFSK